MKHAMRLMLVAMSVLVVRGQEVAIDTNAVPPPVPPAYPVAVVSVQTAADGTLTLLPLSTNPALTAVAAARADSLVPGGGLRDIQFEQSAVLGGWNVSGAFAGGMDQPATSDWYAVSVRAEAVPGDKGFTGGEYLSLETHFNANDSIRASNVIWRAEAASTLPAAIVHRDLVHLAPENRYWRFVAVQEGGASPTNDFSVRSFSFSVVPVEAGAAPVVAPVAVPAVSPGATPEIAPPPKKKRGFFGF
jgi:hypothetical protein